VKNLAVIGVALFVIGLIVVYPVAYLGSEDSATFTVTDKERFTKGQDSKWLVFTESGSNVETFEVADTLLFGSWDSSDRYARLKVGHSYSAKVAGWRLSFFSSNRNIIKATHASNCQDASHSEIKGRQGQRGPDKP
jgi:hypothetical protein